MPNRQRISEAINHLHNLGYDEGRFKRVFNPVKGEKFHFSFESSNAEVSPEEIVSLRVLFEGLNSENLDLILPIFGKL